MSRPNIEFAVNCASQFLDSFRQEHWQAAKKIIRYMIGTRDFGIIFGNSGSFVNVIGLTDADYAKCLDTWKYVRSEEQLADILTKPLQKKAALLFTRENGCCETFKISVSVEFPAMNIILYFERFSCFLE